MSKGEQALLIINFSRITLVNIDECDFDTLKCWTNKNPQERLGKIAKLVDIIEIKDGVVALTRIAAYIINHQDVSSSILSILTKHIEPSSWSGNMSDILRFRKPVFVNLSAHCNPIVSIWAEEVSELIEERITIWENSEFEQNKKKVYPFEP